MKTTLLALLALPLFASLAACEATAIAPPEATCGYEISVPGETTLPKVSCQPTPAQTNDAGDPVYGWMVECSPPAGGLNGVPLGDASFSLPPSVDGCQAVPMLDDASPPSGSSWFCCTTGPFSADPNP
jgi:hypothetical protein